MLGPVVDAARAIAGWWRAPALALARSLGLDANPDLSRLDGTIDGLRVTIREQGGAATTVEVAVPGLPAALWVTAPGPTRSATSLSDVVLDGRISADGIDDLARLGADAVRGPLLAVLFDHGGAVEQGSVVARVRSLREVGEVRTAVRDAVDLGRALADAWERP